MANRVSNRLTVSGPGRESLYETFEKVGEDLFSLPEPGIDPGPDRSPWDVELSREEKGFVLHFSTAWVPALPWAEALSRAWPGLDFLFDHEDQARGETGQHRFREGKLLVVRMGRIGDVLYPQLAAELFGYAEYLPDKTCLPMEEWSIWPDNLLNC